MPLNFGNIKMWRYHGKFKGLHLRCWKRRVSFCAFTLLLLFIKFHRKTSSISLIVSDRPLARSPIVLDDIGIADTEKNNGIITRCRSSLLNPWNKDILPFYSKPESVNCPKLMNPTSPVLGIAFTIKNGNQLHRLVDMGLKCCFQPFYRDTDDFIKYGELCFKIRHNVTVIPKGMDYVQVLCRKKGQNSTIYRDAFPIIHIPIVTPTSFQFRSPNSRPLNIVIIGLDATSRQNFQRQMPLSRDYLEKSMGAISLEGYSVLGSGSRINIVPMLTGLSLRYPLTYFNQSEFYKKCVSLHPNNFNHCPFIWNDFSKRGYITNFADDWTIFNAYWPNAFSKPPTDYYFRPYLLHMQNFAFYGTPTHFCFGPRLAFQAILDNMESVREVAEKLDRPHFQFTWTGRLAHDNLNTLAHGDAPLLRTLMKFKESGAWNNTVIMILGDHGHEKVEYFQTPAGQFEYRLPVAYIVLPSWFPKMYSKSHKNLVENSKGRMTTAFDIYKTLQDFMDWGQLQNGSRVSDNHEGRRGISLFEEIPKTRSCLQAEISPKWCRICHSPISMKNGDELAKGVADFLVKMVNNLIDDDNRNNCMVQSLHRMKNAWKWDSRDIFQEFCDHHGKLAIGRHQGYFHLLPQNLSVSCNLVDIVNMKFMTKPTGAIYHGEVMVIRHDNRQEMGMYLTDDIQRLDRFFSTGNCVDEAKKHYCICKPKHTK